MKYNRLKFAEIILLVLVWIVLIAAPVLFREDKNLDWQDIFGPLETLAPLLIIFLINRFFLVPRLLFKKRNLHYLISVAGLIAVFTLGSYMISGRSNRNLGPGINNHWKQPLPPPPRANRRLPPPPAEPGRNQPIPPFANLLIFSFLLVGFDTGLRASFRLAETEREKAKLEKENVGTQLAFLRNQVSPHFFMNTLNNIHALIDHNSEVAKESIIRLSKLMRHLLYESESAKIAIEKEMDFINNYVDLMKLRYSEKVTINLSLPSGFPKSTIPPLLFTSFIENAFKHGISYQHASFIDIAFSGTEDTLIFEIKNSNPRLEKKEEGSGIGIENARKRLNLIYGDAYSLEIQDAYDAYYVRLTIPL